MVFGNCGVLQSANGLSGKGYVEMTGIDSETSADIADGINGRGGMYLEAQIQGSKARSENGTLCILTAGDRDLFKDCETCFAAIGEHSFYLGKFVTLFFHMNFSFLRGLVYEQKIMKCPKVALNYPYLRVFYHESLSLNLPS